MARSGLKKKHRKETLALIIIGYDNLFLPVLSYGNIYERERERLRFMCLKVNPNRYLKSHGSSKVLAF